MRASSVLGLVLAVLSASAAAWQFAARADTPAAPISEPQSTVQLEPKYMGVDTCKDCHGKSEPQKNKRGTSNQMEYGIWSGPDRHSKAFAVLMEPLTEQIARHLGMKSLLKEGENPDDENWQPPEEWNRCLNCHTMYFVKKQGRNGSKFKLSDGVSCDGCHGPAESWFGPHQERDYSESLKLGMNDIRNPVVRARMCLSCHMGSHAEGKVVDHEMIAAGHPRLVFELDAYCEKLPPHWQRKEPKDGRMPRAQLWAAGQVVGLREAVRLLADDLKSDRWPEYSHFDCASCHHDLKDDDWRKSPLSRMHASAMLTRFPPGRPVWQPGQLSVPSWLIAGTVTGNDTPGEYVRVLPMLERNFLSTTFGHAQHTAEQADRALEMLDEMVKRLETKQIDADDVRKFATSVVRLGETTAWRGHTAALQLTYSLRALLSQSGLVDAGVLERLHEIQKDLESADAAARYDPREFAKQIANLNLQLQ